MILKGIIEEDFINYKKPSMFLAFPHCTFKCEKECGIHCCQNSELAAREGIEVSYDEIVERYIDNNITQSLVFGGLEPFDSFDEMVCLIERVREKTQDDIVIYTGYNEDEVADKLDVLRKYKNIIVKFGRYRPNDTKKYDEVLGINLASSNQYAKKIS